MCWWAGWVWRVRELTLEAPLLLGEGDAVRLQLAVGEPDESGARSLVIYSRRESSFEDGSVEDVRVGSSGRVTPVVCWLSRRRI